MGLSKTQFHKSDFSSFNSHPSQKIIRNLTMDYEKSFRIMKKHRGYKRIKLLLYVNYEDKYNCEKDSVVYFI